MACFICVVSSVRVQLVLLQQERWYTSAYASCSVNNRNNPKMIHATVAYETRPNDATRQGQVADGCVTILGGNSTGRLLLIVTL